jgi:F1F0 ATPase subunit 2
MKDIPMLVAALFAGAALGLLYFLGLWVTVRRVATLRSGPLWLVGSFVLRLALLLAGLYWVGAGDWRRFVAALAGIFLVRLALTRRIGALRTITPDNPSSRSVQ